MDWIACIVDVIAKIMVGNKNRYGFLLYLVSLFLWCIISLTSSPQMWGLFCFSLLYGAINIRNFKKWGKL